MPDSTCLAIGCAPFIMKVLGVVWAIYDSIFHRYRKEYPYLYEEVRSGVKGILLSFIPIHIALAIYTISTHHLKDHFFLYFLCVHGMMVAFSCAMILDAFSRMYQEDWIKAKSKDNEKTESSNYAREERPFETNQPPSETGTNTANQDKQSDTESTNHSNLPSFCEINVPAGSSSSFDPNTAYPNPFTLKTTSKQCSSEKTSSALLRNPVSVKRKH